MGNVAVYQEVPQSIAGLFDALPNKDSVPAEVSADDFNEAFDVLMEGVASSQLKEFNLGPTAVRLHTKEKGHEHGDGLWKADREVGPIRTATFVGQVAVPGLVAPVTSLLSMSTRASDTRPDGWHKYEDGLQIEKDPLEYSFSLDDELGLALFGIQDERVTRVPGFAFGQNSRETENPTLKIPEAAQAKLWSLGVEALKAVKQSIPIDASGEYILD